MMALEMKSEFGYTELGAEDLCRTTYAYVDDDDDIICLDSDDLPTSSSPQIQNASPQPSQISRLLLQIIRLHLSEPCTSPGCAAVAEETQKLRRKLVSLEELSMRLRRICTTQQSEIAKLNEENEKQRRTISLMEGVIKKQAAVVREAESQITSLQRAAARPLATKQHNYSQQKSVNNSQTMNRQYHDTPRPELPVTVQRRVRSEANLPNLGNSKPSPNNSFRERCDPSPQRTNGMVQTPSRAPKPSPTLTRILQTPFVPSSPQTPPSVPMKSNRVKLEVPFANEKSLINFSAPIETPILEYPVECQRCKLAGPKDLSLEIKTEPSNFLFTKKVQGVIRCSTTKTLPRKVRIFCYLESAVNLRRWTSSLLYNFGAVDRMKFEIVFNKEQHVAQFDRVVAFAYGTFGCEKFITERIVFNVGQQNSYISESQVIRHNGISPRSAEPMETDSVPTPSSGRNGMNSALDDSNFEVYRP